MFCSANLIKIKSKDLPLTKRWYRNKLKKKRKNGVLIVALYNARTNRRFTAVVRCGSLLLLLFIGKFLFRTAICHLPRDHIHIFSTEKQKSQAFVSCAGWSMFAVSLVWPFLFDCLGACRDHREFLLFSSDYFHFTHLLDLCHLKWLISFSFIRNSYCKCFLCVARLQTHHDEQALAAFQPRHFFWRW